MLDFCQKLCPFTVPFLYRVRTLRIKLDKLPFLGFLFCRFQNKYAFACAEQAALSLVEKRNGQQHDGAAGIDEEDEPDPSSIPQVIYLQLKSK